MPNENNINVNNDNVNINNDDNINNKNNNVNEDIKDNENTVNITDEQRQLIREKIEIEKKKENTESVTDNKKDFENELKNVLNRLNEIETINKDLINKNNNLIEENNRIKKDNLINDVLSRYNFISQYIKKSVKKELESLTNAKEEDYKNHIDNLKKEEPKLFSFEYNSKINQGDKHFNKDMKNLSYKEMEELYRNNPDKYYQMRKNSRR